MVPTRYANLKVRIVRASQAGQCLQIIEAPDHSSEQGMIDLTLDPATISKVKRLGTQGDELTDFGKAFFEQLFGPFPFGPKYNAVRGEFDADPGVGLRVQVIPQDMEPALTEGAGDALEQLPWEYLYDAAKQRFLALDTEHLSLVRSSPHPGACSAVPPCRPVRMLTVLANANVSGDPQYRIVIDDERKVIEQAVAKAELKAVIGLADDPAAQDPDVEVVITHLDLVLDDEGKPQKASRSALKRYFRDQPKPHIIHFCCHGSHDPTTGEGQLILEQNLRQGQVQGNKDPLPARDVKSWLSDLAPDLRLVVFNACSTARTKNVTAFKSIADAAVQAGVPAVIAMQYDIPLQIALVFTESFHRELFKVCLKQGHSIDLALARAREDILTRTPANMPHWGIPVLYRHPSGVEPFHMVPAAQWEAVRNLISELVWKHKERERLQMMAPDPATGQPLPWIVAELQQIEQRIQDLEVQLQALYAGGNH